MMKRITAVILLVTTIMAACTSADKKTAATKDKYEKTKESLEETEKKNPLLFLAVASDNRRNLVGRTVIVGSLTNNAKVVTYKDVELRVMFYSKTNTLLEEDVETIYEKIAPGTTVKFKKKYTAPKGTDSTALKIMNAKIE